MITTADSFSTYDLGTYYAIFPSDGNIHNVYKKANIDLKPVPANFAYNSGSNLDFLNVDQIRKMICKHVDPSFQPF